MAQEDMIVLPPTDISQPLSPSVHFPTQIRASGAISRDTETASQGYGNIPGPCQENTIQNHSEDDDDEVQFVFSVPRRKRKKRKWYYGLLYSSWLFSNQLDSVGSSYKSTIVRRDSETSASASKSMPRSTSMSSQRLRRGSTGMVRQLDFGHMNGDLQASIKSGSLPTFVATPEPHLPGCQPASDVSSDILQHSAQSLSITDGTPWWSTPLSLAQDNGSFQFDICGMPFAEEILKKRKYYEEPENVRPESRIGSGLGLAQCLQNELLATNNGHISTHGGQPRLEINDVCLDAIGNPGLQCLVREAQPPTTAELTLPLDLTHPIPPQGLPSIPSGKGAKSQSHGQPSKQPARQNSSSVWQQNYDSSKGQAFQVPVSLVPDISVSPRTKTVQIFRPANPNQDQSQNSSLQSLVMLRTTTLSTPPGQLTASANTQSTQSMNLGSYRLGTRIPGLVSLSQTPPGDILRKPSLYKIPLWPSPPISPHQPQYIKHKQSHLRLGDSKKSPIQVQGLVSRNMIPSAVIDTTHLRRTPRDEPQPKSYAKPRVALTSSSEEQEKFSRPAAVMGQAHAVQSTYKRPPNTTNNCLLPNPSPAPTNKSTRKHSPNM
jgi:hypothetical protein